MPLLLLAAVWLMGCSGASATDSVPTLAPTLAPLPTATSMRDPTAIPFPSPTPIPPMEGLEAPDFAIKLFQGEDILGGRELRLSDLSGRPLVLNFWARLCTPCWTEMPELQDFYEEYEDRVLLLGIDVGQFTGLGSPKDASRLLDSIGVTYPAGYTDDANVVRHYRIRAMPTTIFISSDGRVLQAWTGAINREQIEAIVNSMLRGDKRHRN